MTLNEFLKYYNVSKAQHARNIKKTVGSLDKRKNKSPTELDFFAVYHYLNNTKSPKKLLGH